MADAREAWYLETASGHHWMAQRVPHGSVFFSANQGRFRVSGWAGGRVNAAGVEGSGRWKRGCLCWWFDMGSWSGGGSARCRGMLQCRLEPCHVGVVACIATASPPNRHPSPCSPAPPPPRPRLLLQAMESDTLTSPGLLQFAADQGLYDPATQPFSFFACFVEDIAKDRTYNAPRVRALERFFAGRQAEDQAEGVAEMEQEGQQLGGGSATAAAAASTDVAAAADDDSPGGRRRLPSVFPRPSRRLSVWDVAAALRIHYDGSPHDPYGGGEGGSRRLAAAPKKDTWRPVTLLREWEHGGCLRSTRLVCCVCCVCVSAVNRSMGHITPAASRDV